MMTMVLALSTMSVVCAGAKAFQPVLAIVKATFWTIAVFAAVTALLVQVAWILRPATTTTQRPLMTVLLTLDCNGDCGGTAEIDACGVCGGDDTSCAGCTDSTACNYDDTATIDDGSCEFDSCAGCTNADACNYDDTATIDDGSCLTLDCNGDCGGTAEEDALGVCGRNLLGG